VRGETGPSATVGMARKAQKRAARMAAKKAVKQATNFESVRYQKQAQKAMEAL
jgi:formate-dependent nitrite reductase cytochrome c552 subunit